MYRVVLNNAVQGYLGGYIAMFNCNEVLVMKDYVNVKPKRKTIRKRLSENSEEVKCAIAFAVLVVLFVIIFST